MDLTRKSLSISSCILGTSGPCQSWPYSPIPPRYILFEPLDTIAAVAFCVIKSRVEITDKGRHILVHAI